MSQSRLDAVIEELENVIADQTGDYDYVMYCLKQIVIHLKHIRSQK